MPGSKARRSARAAAPLPWARRMLLRHPRLVLVAAAILLMAPSLVLGTLLGHDAPHTLKWGSEFEEQFRAGILYPRWLPGYFDGIGAPVFYFYPPFSYWMDG